MQKTLRVMTREEQFSRLVMAAEPRSFWLDQLGAPLARRSLRGEAAADRAAQRGAAS